MDVDGPGYHHPTGEVMLVGDGLEERTVAIGENLQVVCVTATVPTGGSLLQSGSI
jgi:hypothetical protein